jgi:hypothetical protein
MPPQAGCPLPLTPLRRPTRIQHTLTHCVSTESTFLSSPSICATDAAGQTHRTSSNYPRIREAGINPCAAQCCLLLRRISSASHPRPNHPQYSFKLPFTVVQLLGPSICPCRRRSWQSHNCLARPALLPPHPRSRDHPLCMLPVAAPHLLRMLLARCRQHRSVELAVELLDACLQHLPVVQLAQVDVLEVVQQSGEVGEHHGQLVWAGGCQALWGLCRRGCLATARQRMVGQVGRSTTCKLKGGVASSAECRHSVWQLQSQLQQAPQTLLQCTQPVRDNCDGAAKRIMAMRQPHLVIDLPMLSLDTSP